MMRLVSFVDSSGADTRKLLLELQFARIFQLDWTYFLLARRDVSSIALSGRLVLSQMISLSGVASLPTNLVIYYDLASFDLKYALPSSIRSSPRLLMHATTYHRVLSHAARAGQRDDLELFDLAHWVAVPVRHGLHSFIDLSSVPVACTTADAVRDLDALIGRRILHFRSDFPCDLVLLLLL